MSPYRRRGAVPVALIASAALVLTACSGGGDGDDRATDDGGGGAGEGLTVWSLENLPDRMQVTQGIVDAFTEETGIEVELVGIDEGQAPQLVQSGAIGGELPDVMGALSLAYVRQFDDQELIDVDANAAVVEALGADTWEESALELTRDGDRQLSVPSDAWTQILVYRTDLFEAEGLEPPDTYESLEAAAEALTKDGMFGITLATDPADVFTSQTFESLALGNNCQLVDDGGNATLDSPECLATWELYQALAQDYSPSGTQTVDSTRATYFAGQAAMTMWSTFLLDELAGLRNDALPACPECADDPGFLAENTGIVSSVAGPDGEGASYGEVTSWTVMDGAATEEAQQFIEYMLSTGYLDWLDMAPEGKFPVRVGNEEDPTAYTDGWAELEAGVDTFAPLSEIYDEATMEQITSVAERVDRWAIPQGQGAILGPTITELPISQAVAEMGAGSLDAAGAAERAQAAVEEIAAGVG
ncbi:ABC transporter substrate-binding protein [Georgenia muralis]|uniref:Multiple sugar transport system substrate-binding protein n=1 Tax=Georgenia muralis TaxID=154117 RepID=A0A3N4Z157_9MICO|nr:extracellular solute-binding protein [Georgenia muralis]RPF27019.1 multiple sugar transport system substrate-binding protein [Georgenia muralis]